jgi:hypothetical protein
MSGQEPARDGGCRTGKKTTATRKDFGRFLGQLQLSSPGR